MRTSEYLQKPMQNQFSFQKWKPDSENLINPIVFQFLFLKNPEKWPTSLKKHCLQKVSASCFLQWRQPYKTNRKSTFPWRGRTHHKSIQNKANFSTFYAKSGKRASKHWKTPATERFRDAFVRNEEPYKANRKSIFREFQRRIKTL